MSINVATLDALLRASSSRRYDSVARELEPPDGLPRTSILSLPSCALVTITSALGLSQWRAALRATSSTLWRLGGEATTTLAIEYEECGLASKTCALTFPRATQLRVSHGGLDPPLINGTDGLLMLLWSSSGGPAQSIGHFAEESSAAADAPVHGGENAAGVNAVTVRSSGVHQPPAHHMSNGMSHSCASFGARLSSLDLSASSMNWTVFTAAIAACPNLVNLALPRLVSDCRRRLSAAEFRAVLASLALLNSRHEPPSTSSPRPDISSIDPRHPNGGDVSHQPAPNGDGVKQRLSESSGGDINDLLCGGLQRVQVTEPHAASEVVGTAPPADHPCRTPRISLSATEVDSASPLRTTMPSPGLSRLSHLSLTASADSLVSAEHLAGLQRLTRLESLSLALCTSDPDAGGTVLAWVGQLTCLTHLDFDGPAGGSGWQALLPLSGIRRLSGVVPSHSAGPLPWPLLPPLLPQTRMLGSELRRLEAPTMVLTGAELHTISARCPVLEVLASWSVSHSLMPCPSYASLFSGVAVLSTVRQLEVSRVAPNCVPLSDLFPSLTELSVFKTMDLPPGSLMPVAPTLRALHLREARPAMIFATLQTAVLTTLVRLASFTWGCKGGLPPGALFCIARSCPRLLELRIAPAGDAFVHAAGSTAATPHEHAHSTAPPSAAAVAASRPTSPRQRMCPPTSVPPRRISVGRGVTSTAAGALSPRASTAAAIRRLSAPGCRGATIGIAAALLVLLPRLSVLEVEAARGLTADDVMALVSSLSMRRLVLRDCHDVSSEECRRVLAEYGRPDYDMQWEGLPTRL